MHDSNRLIDTVNQFCRSIESHPEAAITEQAWGHREVLAHLVYHHELYIQLVNAFLAGLPSSPSGGTFRELNVHAIAQNHDLPIDHMIKRFQEVNGQLVGICKLNDPDSFIIEIKAGAKLRTLQTLAPERWKLISTTT